MRSERRNLKATARIIERQAPGSAEGIVASAYLAAEERIAELEAPPAESAETWAELLRLVGDHPDRGAILGQFHVLRAIERQSQWLRRGGDLYAPGGIKRLISELEARAEKAEAAVARLTRIGEERERSHAEQADTLIAQRDGLLEREEELSAEVERLGSRIAGTEELRDRAEAERDELAEKLAVALEALRFYAPQSAYRRRTCTGSGSTTHGPVMSEQGMKAREALARLGAESPSTGPEESVKAALSQYRRDAEREEIGEQGAKS